MLKIALILMLHIHSSDFYLYSILIILNLLIALYIYKQKLTTILVWRERERDRGGGERDNLEMAATLNLSLRGKGLVIDSTHPENKQKDFNTIVTGNDNRFWMTLWCKRNFSQSPRKVLQGKQWPEVVKAIRFTYIKGDWRSREVAIFKYSLTLIPYLYL